MQSQKSRAGRPRMQDSADSSSKDDDASRKARMRMAQRRYRSKKQNTLAAAEQKAVALENTLRGTLNSFRNFQKSLLQHPPGYVPLDIAVQLSKTSLEISNLLHSSGVKSQDTIGCDLLDCTKKPCIRRVMAEKFMQATVEHNLNIVENGELGCFRPELLAGMNVLPGEILLAQTMTQASPDPLGDIDYLGSFVPQLHRKVEGSTETVLRLAPPKLQRLQFGRTRTWFETNVPELAGEWLEAPDVEEYLHERGIHVRKDSATTVTLHLGAEGNSIGSAGPGVTSDADSDGPLTPEWQPDLPDWTIFGKQLDTQQDIPSGVAVMSPSTLYWDEQSPSTSSIPATPSAQAKITIDVTKLIDGLSKRGVCLGPAPGIRRHDVDEAIREAVQLA